MTAVIKELRTQIETAQRNLAIANQAGLPYESHLHHARLEDLMDIAARHEIDVSAWVDRSLLSPLVPAQGQSP
jgi:hypothetical protein